MSDRLVRDQPSGRIGVRGRDELSHAACAGSATLWQPLRPSRVSFRDSAGRCDAAGHSRGKNEKLDGRFEMTVFSRSNRLAAISFEQYLLVAVRLFGVRLFGARLSSAHFPHICSLFCPGRPPSPEPPPGGPPAQRLPPLA